MKSIIRIVSLAVVCVWPLATSLHAQVPVTSGLGLWFDASQINGVGNPLPADNAAVLSWEDISPASLHDTTASLSPTFKTGQINGLPAVKFLGNNFVSIDEWHVGDDGTQFFVLKRNDVGNSTVAGPGPGDDTHAQNSYGMLLIGGDMYSNGSTHSTGGVFSDTTSYHIIETVKPGLGFVTQFYFDGVLVPSANADGFQLHERTFGGSVYGAFPFDGYLAEVLVYDRALSGAESTSVTTYLNDKYFAVAEVPEPSSVLLLGLAGLLAWRFRRS